MRLNLNKIEDIYYSQVLSKFVQLGYDYILSPSLNLTLYNKNKVMPNIQIHTTLDSSYYMYTPTLEFPTLSYEDAVESVPWILEQWAEVGKACENLYLFSFNEDDCIGE